MYYILFGGRQSKGNIALCQKLGPNWVTFDSDPENFLKALKVLNMHNPKAYNLVILDPYLARAGKRVDYIDNVLNLNLNRRRTLIIKDNLLENTVEQFREKYQFDELSAESNLVTAVNFILNLS